MCKPKVSVVVATYRREEALKNALKSLVNQSYTNVEIIVVDDNADVQWNEKVEKIVGEFPQVIYIKNEENKGSAKTRNIGIEKATGEYVTFLDDDDEYLPEKIERQLKNMMEANADYGITDLLLYNENGKLSDSRIRDYIKETDNESLFKYHLKYHMSGTDTMMFKKEYLLKIGAFDAIDVGDEFYLMSKAINEGGKFNYFPDCDVKALVHQSEPSISYGDGKIKGEEILYQYKEKYFHRLSSKDIRYIKARHFAVMAFTYMRQRKIGLFVANAFKSFIASPMQCLQILVKR